MQHINRYICPMKYDYSECIGSRLRKISRMVDSHFRQHLVDFDITENQMTILFAMSKMKKVEQGRIGKYLYLEKSTVSRNIKLLEKRGFVSRSSDYRPTVELTDEGYKMVETLTPVWLGIMDELVGVLGSSGLDGLRNLETKMRT
ncbi:MarR family winged helix-turn-helix transcriptional regulator [Flagellimonas algicola]|uniref:Winged helix-turn-helix transcriptional regulator n=1 Tax=Flagellimonas algicola TaxID=2583815 RepID=A0ABY2WPA4_9FLAO|nr:MarR family winged helix-turn-helix transcriptional regulator [Allomuricauda algicola]TMU56572.1 winged helix-turn-helix transcriptional regulator [Allomuricauda algicola]